MAVLFQKRSLSAKWVGLLFGFSVLALDLSVRWSVLGEYSARERNQYFLSILGGLLFWMSLAELGAWAKERSSAWALSSGIGLFVLASSLVLMPLGSYRLYRRLPGEDAHLFVANEWRFALHVTWDFIDTVWPFVGLWILWVAVFGWLLHTSRSSHAQWRLFPVLYLLILGASSVQPSVPLMLESNSLKFLTSVVLWRGNPPPYFKLPKRTSSKVEAQAPQFHVVLLVGETIGAQYLEAPSGKPVAPYLVSMRQFPEVVTFENMHSVSSCTDVSVPTIVSGLAPSVSLTQLAESPTLLDVFASPSTWRVVYSSQPLTWAGMDEYLGVWKMDDHWSPRAVSEARDDVGVPDKLAFDKLLQAFDVAEKRGKRLVAVVKLNTGHGPYATHGYPEPFHDDLGFGFSKEPNFPRYLNAVSAFDAQLKEFFEVFRGKPYAENTLLAFTSDHGEAFGQHGNFAHCGAFHVEESHVPGLVWLPLALRGHEVEARLRANRKARVSTIDLFPTLLELAGKGVESSNSGVSLTTLATQDRVFEFTNCALWRRCSQLDFGLEVNGVRRFIDSNRRWVKFEVINGVQSQNGTLLSKEEVEHMHRLVLTRPPSPLLEAVVNDY